MKRFKMKAFSSKEFLFTYHLVNMKLDMLLVLAKYSFLGLGLKEMMSVVIAGGSFKEATTSGMQYLLTYVLIKLYPSLFNMFSKINF